jgi:8-oxo-dGTP diphosphatase
VCIERTERRAGVRGKPYQGSVHAICYPAAKGEIRQNYYFFAKLIGETDIDVASTEGTSRWFSFSELPALEMPYTAKFVIEHYLETGRRTDEMYVGVADGKHVAFIGLPQY